MGGWTNSVERHWLDVKRCARNPLALSSPSSSWLCCGAISASLRAPSRGYSRDGSGGLVLIPFRLSPFDLQSSSPDRGCFVFTDRSRKQNTLPLSQITMSETCHRSGQKVYAADNPVRIGGLVFHPGHFTCKATGTKLTLKNCVIGTDPENGEKDVYLRGKEPWHKPHQVMGVNDDRVANVPDSAMRTTDRKFNIAGQGETRGGADDEHHGSSYGAGAVAMETALNAPKKPTTVDNINKREIRHNGTETYTGATEAEPAE
eukprot:m.115488 g.115488  ORF g.115488 m.115488 type:complete len:260 (+) comp13094_c0_seq3:72-851(+)